MKTTRLDGLLFSIGLATAVCVGAVAGQTVEFMATADVWIRESNPTRLAYEDDLISVWSSHSLDGARRYGLVEFDLSSLAGSRISGISLGLFSGIHEYSDYRKPIKQNSYVIIPPDNVTLQSLTWNSYRAQLDPGKIDLEGLGAYQLPAPSSDPTQQNKYVYSEASPADLAVIQQIVEGGGRLCLVMVTDELDGIDYARSWIDDNTTWPNSRPKLKVTLAGGKAYNPTPHNGAIMVVPDTLMSWEIGKSIDPKAPTYTLYIDTDMDLGNTVPIPLNTPMYDPPVVLNGNTTYYWRVDVATSDHAVYTGDLWSFQTAPVKNEYDIAAISDLWIRETYPTTTYDNDGITVWSTAKGDRRYGLLEFDLSSLAGCTVASATLQLYSAIHGWSDYSTPIRQTAGIINCSTGTSLNSLTWASYMSEKDAGRISLESLGRYDLPPASTDPAQQNQYVNSLASSSDLELIQGAVDGDGRFCVVLMADENAVYGHSWGDGDGNWSGLVPTLHIELLTAQAYAPTPDDGAVDVGRDVLLTWRSGKDATSHNIYFGMDYDSVNNAEYPSVLPGRGSVSSGDENFTPPSSLEGNTTYYWRIDEIGPLGGTRGNVWTFTTVSGKVTKLDPCDGAYTIPRDPILHWSANSDVTSYNVYLGTDFDQVYAAGNSDVFPGRGSLSADQAYYQPEEILEPDTIYFWRVDAIYSWGISIGDVLKFHTTPSDPTTCDGVTGMNLGLACDYNRDCRVDLTDLVDFAQKWLQDVFLEQYVILAEEWRKCNDPKDLNCERPWRNLAATCLNTLIEHGTDVYGSIHTPMLMAILDVNTLSSPEVPEMYDDYIRTEGRPDHGRRSPGGSNPWLDQPLIKALYLCSKKTGDSKYADAADAYLSYFMDHCRKPNGLFYWGSHSYWQAFTETYGGDGIHEILILHPDWLNMYRLNPQAVATEVDQIWQLHVCNKITGEHNRHDSGSCGLDFAFSGGSFAIAFAFMYHVTGDPAYLDKARLIADRHWSHRNSVTNLPPDAPTTDRYDGTHCMTSVTGPHVSQLLRCYELTGDNHFRDIAIAYIKAYEKYGWDEAAGTYWGMLQLDGTPVDGVRTTSGGYDIWAPRGHVEVWQTTMFSYEFPLTAAQAAVYAYEQSDYGNGRNPELLAVARHWARVIEDNLPPYLGSWWGNDVAAAMPDVRLTGGTYAENYGRAISFFVHVYRATKEQHYLDVAEAIATEAVEKLYANGLFKGHPAKPYYQSNDGVGLLLYALLELDNPDEILDGAF